MRRLVVLAVIAAVLGLLLSCPIDRRKESGVMHDDSLATDLAVLKTARIYFGHQSVGSNILQGMQVLASASDGTEPLRVTPLSDTITACETFFTDAYIGENTRPDTKCSAFARSFTRFTHHLPEVALMKFCFVDFGQSLKADEIFSLYCSTVDTLRKRYPGVVFVHVTAPLTARPTGLKNTIRQLLGRGGNFTLETMERNRFNTLLVDHFRRDPIFDLARIESTHPDGSRERVTVDGRAYFALVPGYSDDGGHLNELGQQIAGRELIRTLANTLRERREKIQTALPK